MKIYKIFLIALAGFMACSQDKNEPVPLMEDMKNGPIPLMNYVSDIQLIDSLSYPSEPINFSVNVVSDEYVNVTDGEVLVDYIYTRENPETGRDEVYTETASLDNFTTLPAEFSFGPDEIQDLFGLSFEDLLVGDVFVVRPSYNLDNGLENVDSWSGDICREIAYEASCQLTIPYSCLSDLPVEGVTYDMDITVTSACCGLPVGKVEEGATTTIAKTGATEYTVGSIFGGWLNVFNFGDEPISFVDFCKDYSLRDANSLLLWTGAGSEVQVDEATGVITIYWNNAPNGLRGYTVYTPQE